MKAVAQKTNQTGTPNSLVQRKGSEPFFGVQAKLTVGKPNDKYEKEADSVADKVVAKTKNKDTFFGNNSFFPSARSASVQKVPFEDIQNKEESDELQEKSISEGITKAVQLETVEEETVQKVPFEDVQRKLDPVPIAPETQTKEEEQQEQEEEDEVPVQAKTMLIYRKSDGTPEVTSGIESRIQRASSGGQPMSKNVKRSMESGFGSDFSNVRVHTNQESSSLNSQLSARAFTYKNNIFFGRNQYQPNNESGKHLLAHELTHVVQQGHAVQRKPEISSQNTEPQVQRLGVSDALDYFADAAHNLMGFRMFTIILGVNPINMSSVDRGAANIMRAIVEFLPGGKLITRVLDKYNVFTEAAAWMEQQVNSLNITGASIKKSIMDFLKSLGWTDILRLGGVWRDAKAIIMNPIDAFIAIGGRALTKIYEIVKKAILTPIAGLAKSAVGEAYELLVSVLGKDPVTGDITTPDPGKLIGGFMKLIGQDEVWSNIQKGNALGRAWIWFKGTLNSLKSIVIGIPGTIIATIKSLTWDDIIVLPNAFIKVGKAFLGIAGSFGSWALGTVIDLLKILFSVVAPGVMPYLEKAGAAFNTILENPVGFVGNLVQAAKLGFQKFAARIGKHLKDALLDWLLGSLAGAGIYIPQALEFKEILKFAASVLGLTWENLRIKLVKHLGEPAVKALEVGFELVKILVTEGPAAAWEKIMEHLSNLKDMVIGEITQFVVVTVVQKAITKLILMLNPAGAVISAIIAIYDTIMFVVNKLQQIARVGAAIIDSIAAIASGVITAAIDKVEQTLAGMLTLAVNFLAKFAGLDKISAEIIKIINKIREPIDKAMDSIVGWLVAKGKAFLKKLLGKNKDEGNDTKDVKSKVKAEIKSSLQKKVSDPSGLDAKLSAIFSKYQKDGLKYIKVSRVGETAQFKIHIAASPEEEGGEFILNPPELEFKDLVPQTRKDNVITWIIATFNGLSLGRIENTPGANHAEENLVGVLNAKWDQLPHKEDAKDELTVDINNSPCGASTGHNCSALLHGFAASKNIILRLKIISFYSGQSYKHTGGKSSKGKDKEPGSFEGLELLLSNPDISIDILSVADLIEKWPGYKDLNEDQQKQLAKRIDMRNGKLVKRIGQAENSDQQ